MYKRRHKAQTIHYINVKILSSSLVLPAAYCVYDATPLPSPPSRSCLFIYRPRVHTWGPSISTPERVLGSWDSSCDISYSSTFHPRQFSFSLVLVSYTFPAPACVFSPIPWVLGLSISFHFILPLPSELPCFFPFWQQLHFFFQITQRCINIDSTHTSSDYHVAS